MPRGANLVQFDQAAVAGHRHLGKPKLAGREQPPMTSKDAALLVYQHRVRPPELNHRRRDLISPARPSACAGCARMGAASRHRHKRAKVDATVRILLDHGQPLVALEACGEDHAASRA